MEKHLEAALDFYRTKGITIESELLGDRPCGRDVDEEKEKALIERTANAIKAHYGPEPLLRSASTDCNIPLSMGIPSICTGCIIGAGAHTRGEWVAIDSLHPGLLVAFEMVLHHFN
jgi:di/tripeptidase